MEKAASAASVMGAPEKFFLFFSTRTETRWGDVNVKTALEASSWPQLVLFFLLPPREATKDPAMRKSSQEDDERSLFRGLLFRFALSRSDVSAVSHGEKSTNRVTLNKASYSIGSCLALVALES